MGRMGPGGELISMAKKQLIFILGTMIFGQMAFAEVIRVRLGKNLSDYLLRSTQAQVFLCEKNQKCESKKHLGNLLIDAQPEGLVYMGKHYKSIYVSSSSMIGEEGERLPSSLNFVFKSNLKVDKIANINIEKYLAGVLPSEMPASWPYESLKAQAIASRSYVLYQKKNNQRLHFDVDSDVMDQVFKIKRLPAAYQAKIQKIISETKGLVIVRSGTPVKAFFHSHCGGHTEMAANVWPGSLGFNTVKDPYCQAKLPLNWKLTKSYKELEDLYKKDTKDYSVSGLHSVQKGERNLSGRLENLFLFFKNGKIRKWNTLGFRKTIGFSRIKSTRFEIQKRDKGVQVAGSGYGHGVGLCQHGAKVMAKVGKSYKQILEHYYPKTRIISLNEVDKAQSFARK